MSPRLAALSFLLALLTGVPAATAQETSAAAPAFEVLLEGGARLRVLGPVEETGGLLVFGLDGGRRGSLPLDSVIEVRPSAPASTGSAGESPAEETVPAPAAPSPATLRVPPPRTQRRYTNADLPPGAETDGRATPAPPAPDEAEPPPPLGYETLVDRNGHGEAWWRERARGLAERLAASEARVTEAERRLEAWKRYSVELLSEGSIPRAVGREITVARQELESAITVRDELRGGWEALREEARVAGALPGWLR